MIVTDEDFRNGNITNLKKLFTKAVVKIMITTFIMVS